MNKNPEKKRQEEKLLVSHMIALYCRKKHGTEGLCPQCRALESYAFERSDRCPFMAQKSFCSNCRVHCYKADMRRQIKEVMAFSGPRLIFSHPLKVLSHLWYTIINKLAGSI